MNATKIFDRIDDLEKEYLRVWEDICNIESPTSFKAGVDAVCEYITALAEKKGWETEHFPQPVSGNAACIVINPSADSSPICLSGHMDTVHPVGSFGTPPVRIDGEMIYGPGVCDCKGGIVAALLAMDAMDSEGFDLRPVKLILQSDEEVNSTLSDGETIRFMCEKSKNAAAFLNLEGHSQGKACIARKGIVSYTFTVTGQEAHSSKCATDGANAIIDAAHKMIMLDKIKDDDGLTCNCAIVSGGTVVNTVPGKCVFKVNVRYATAEQREWMDSYAQKVAETVHVPGCTCEVVNEGGRIAMELTDHNAELLRKMNVAFEKHGLPTLEGVRRNGGSDAAYVTESGIPCIDSLGVRGKDIHSGNERAYLASLAEAAKRIVAVALEL
ncbi:MAG: M20/M25/M40 family metallo-hydrolase [Clostridia bacterium]|nr:M20/M25/M40 family metallo-hydrolase [Clostridia bacterium]